MNIFVIHSGSDKSAATTVDRINKISKLKEKAAKAKTTEEAEKALREVEAAIKFSQFPADELDDIDGSRIANVCLLNKRRIWKPEAKRRIKSSNIVLYLVDKKGFTSKNIAWEIRQAKKMKKAILILNSNAYPMNPAINDKDPYTKAVSNKRHVIKTLGELFEIIDNYELGKYINLFNEDKKDPARLFEQYKLFSDTSEALVSRRQNVNSFYITANTAIITIVATAFGLNSNLLSQLIITLVLSFPAILLNFSWLKLLESYSLLNSSKMKILGLLEKELAASLFDAEWQVMGNQYNAKRYVSFSEREKNLPIIFNCVFIIVDIICAIIILSQYIF